MQIKNGQTIPCRRKKNILLIKAHVKNVRTTKQNNYTITNRPFVRIKK